MHIQMYQQKQIKDVSQDTHRRQNENKTPVGWAKPHNKAVKALFESKQCDPKNRGGGKLVSPGGQRKILVSLQEKGHQVGDGKSSDWEATE
jgi:hypothetical protein